MAFTISFPTTRPTPSAEDIGAWLTEQGEAFEVEGPDALALRAMPVRLVLDAEGKAKAQVDLTPAASLTRVVGLLFDLSNRLGADVKLAGAGNVNRSELWLRFADEQDRLRLAEALAQAREDEKADRVSRGVWSLLHAVGRGRDLRWDAQRDCIVEMKEVGAPDGISVEDAAWQVDSPEPGDLVGVPVQGDVHILAWRWLAEAWPRLAAT